MKALETRSVPVMTDGGTRDGLLVLADGALAAVLIPVSREESQQAIEVGWYLEAGFGPCSTLLIPPPDVFEATEQALAWIEGRIAAVS